MDLFVVKIFNNNRIKPYLYVCLSLLIMIDSSTNLYAQSNLSQGRFYTSQDINKKLSQMGLCTSRMSQLFNYFTSVSVPDQPKAAADSFQVGYNANKILGAMYAAGMDSESAAGMLRGYVAPVYRGFLNDSAEQRYIPPTPVTPQSGCTNPGFETGNFTGWTGTTGCDTLDHSNINCSGFTPGIVNGRQTIMSGAGTDPYGGFPVVNPNGGGSFSARLGNDNTGSESEQLKYSFVITSNTTSFTYWYAVVLEDPSGHSNVEQPWFQVNMNVNGQDIPCGDYFVAGNSATGFSQTTTGGFFGETVMYKAWTPVTVDLSPYLGQTVTLTFTTADCSLGGHFGYAYIDCSCDPEAILQNHQFCHISDPVQLSLPGYGSYQWSTGATTSSINVNAAGVYSVQTTTLTGCPGPTVYDTVSLHPNPIADFTNNGGCTSTINFTDASTVSGSSITGWNWNFGDGNTSTSQNPTHTYSPAGNYIVQLITTASDGCMDTISKTLTTGTPPTAQFTASTVCQNNSTAFTDQSNGNGSTITGWSWDFGDGSNSTQQNPIHVYANAGTYTVQLTVTAGSGCSNSVTNTVTVNPLPTADFSVPTVCQGNASVFTDQSNGNGSTLSGWNWSFGDGNTATQQNPSDTYASAGTYNVQLTVTTAQGCKDSIVKQATVNPLPTAAFTGTNVCEGLSTDFVDQSTSTSGTVSSWSWNFGDGASSSVQNPSHTYSTAGTYTVVLTAGVSATCQSTDSNTVTVYPNPTADFSSTTVCLNNATNFTDQSSGNGGVITSWSWDFGEPSSGISNTSSSENPSHTYSNAGPYTVKLVVTSSSGCIDSITHTVYVNPLPVAAFTGTTECLGSATSFTDQSTMSGGNITGWSWNFGEPSSGPNNISAQQNPTHTYASSGVVPVILTVTSDSGCQSTVTQNITVNPMPTASFTASTECAGTTTQFTDGSSVSSGNIASWNWDFGDGNSSTQQNPTHLYSTNGTYAVTLTVTTNGGCQSSVTDSVLVNAMPVADFSATNVCLNVTTVFTDESSIPAPGVINSWNWDFGDGASSVGQNPSHAYAAPGTYTVTLTVTSAAGCDSAISKTVTVYPLPHADFTNTNVCDSTVTTFTDSSLVSSGSITIWQWSFGDGGYSTTESPTHLYNSPGNYTTGLLVTTDHGCKDSISKPVSVYYNPVVAFSVDSPAGCAVHCVNLTDSSSVGGGDSLTNWLWNFGDGSYSIGQNPSHCYPDAGTYSVGLTVTSNHNCQASYTHPDMITVYPLPTAEFSVSPQPTTIVNALIHFTDQSLDAVLWHWNFGDGDTLGLTTENPEHSYEDTGRYTASLIVYNQYGCRDSIAHDVLIGPQFTFYIPNAFSPNGDGVNDYFSGKGVGIKKYQMWIFDRWGNMIFYTNDINKPWDGKDQRGSSDAYAQEDVYVWMVQLTDVFGKKHRYIGHVSLIK